MEVWSLLVLIVIICGERAESTSFTIINNCPHPIWPATVTTSAHTPPLQHTGFALGPSQSMRQNAPSGWVGRIWARTFCATNSSGFFACAMGDCGTGLVSCNNRSGAPPITVAKFTIDGFDDNDFYDVSLVKGFNLAVTITPQITGCLSTGCISDVNGACPSDLAVRESEGGRDVIACQSACEAFHTDAYCCKGDVPQTCSSSNYSRFFKTMCPQAKSYSKDDGASITCPNGGDYVVTFCPWTQPKFIGMLCEL